MPILLGKEKKHPREKQQKWYRTAVMPCESMAQGVYPNHPGQENYTGFKPEIMDDINTENRKAG
jgi:hypothetical protein